MKRLFTAFCRRSFMGGLNCLRNSFRSIWPLFVVSNCWKSRLTSSSFFIPSLRDLIAARNSSNVIRPERSEIEWTVICFYLLVKTHHDQSQKRFRSNPIVSLYFPKDVDGMIPSFSSLATDERRQIDKLILLSVRKQQSIFSLALACACIQCHEKATISQSVFLILLALWISQINNICSVVVIDFLTDKNPSSIVAYNEVVCQQMKGYSFHKAYQIWLFFEE